MAYFFIKIKNENNNSNQIFLIKEIKYEQR